MPNAWENDPIATDEPKAATSVFESKTKFSPVSETARSFGLGSTFGFEDELEAALRSGSISNQQYQQVRNQLRAQQEQFKYEAPELALSSELLGSVVMPLGLLKTLKTASPAIQAGVTGESLLGQVARGAAVGAGTGALSAAGSATRDTGEQAAVGGVFGGVLGGTVPVAIKGASNLIRSALNASGIGDQESAAAKILMNRLQKADLTPDEAFQSLEDLRKLGVPSPVIADLNKSLQDLAYSSYVVPSKAKDSTLRFLESRLIDQPNDIVKGLADKAGLNQNVNGYEYLNSLVKNQQSAARTAYPEAYSKALDARDFRKYVDRPVFEEAYKEAQRRAGVYGETLPDLNQVRNAQFVPTDVLHQIKIGLDRIVDSNTDAVTGKVTAYGRDVSNVRKEFNDLIKEKNTAYAQANAKFADSQRIQDAFITGQKYQSLDPAQALDKLKKMNDAEKESFRLGMMADINRRLGEFKGGDFSRQVFKSDKQKSLLRYAFDDSTQYSNFAKYVDALGQQSKTAKTVIGGSQTGERLATSEEAARTGSLAQSFATGGLPGAAIDTLRQMAARTKGISGETSAELQKRLFTTDPVEQRAILEELKKRIQRKPVGLVPSSAAIGTMTGLLGD